MSKLRLLSPYSISGLPLTNRVVMAPMTRTRANGPHDTPTALMALYYSQRATAGLIISEATHVSADAIGYENAPGIFSPEQVEGWKMITSAVHAGGGKIFVQLFHTGRLSHPYFQPNGLAPLAPSDVEANNCFAYITNYHRQTIQIPFTKPSPMTGEQIENVINQFATAARHAIDAGFDGVEIHGANGYLLEQFINPHVNTRSDEYGGSIDNRIKLPLRVVDAVSAAIGHERTGLRLSPFGTLHDMPEYAEAESTYTTLVNELNKRDLAFLHIFDQSAFGTGKIPDGFLHRMRSAFKNTIILNGGYNKERAEEAIVKDIADLISFGRPFIGNPDLVKRFEDDLPLTESDRTRWYGIGGASGYVDYHFYNENSLLTTK